MAPVEDLGTYDVIIIGAGMSGLMAANVLAQQGWRALLIEKGTGPGGCTVNFQRKGFRFDASTHLINGCESGGSIYEELRKVGAEDRVEFVKLQTLMDWTDDARGISTQLPVALPAYVDTLSQLYPHEEKGIREFYRRYESVAKLLLSNSGTSESEQAALFMQHPEVMQDFAALQGKSAKDIVDRYVSDPDLIEMMTILTGLFGLGYDEIDAFLFVMADLGYRLEGAYYPKGGSGYVSEVLADLFEARGGTILLDHQVTSLSLSDGLVDGVVMRRPKGQEFAASARTIVAASDLTALVGELCPPGALAPEFIEKIEERVPCVSAVILYAGIDFDLRERGITGYEIHRTWGELSSSELVNEIATTGDYSRLPSGNATVYSNVDPGCCPEGKSLISTLAYATPELFEGALDRGWRRGRTYGALKQKITDQLLEKMARTLGIPDLADHVEVIELATPVTLKRYTSNRGGSFVGWSITPGQGVFNAIPQQSPVPNLFLCGQWVFPGGGVAPAMMSGSGAAELADAYLKKKG